MTDSDDNVSGDQNSEKRKPRPYPPLSRTEPAAGPTAKPPTGPEEPAESEMFSWPGSAYTPPGAPAPLDEMVESAEYLTPGTDFHVDALVRPVPPRRGTRIKHSIGLYLGVLGTISGLATWGYFALRSQGHGSMPLVFWSTIVIDVFALLVLVLRLVRGSVLDAEERARTELVYRPEPSDRIAKRLHGGEYVLFETKLHALSIVPTMIKRLWHGKWRRRFFVSYLVLLAIAWTGYGKESPLFGTGWFMVILAVIPAFLVLSLYEWSRERYALTNERLIGISGIVAAHVGEMPRERMTDVGTDTEWYSNVLAWCRVIKLPFSTWDVESAGQDQRLKLIPGVPMGDVVVSVFSLSKRPNQEE
jgi:hypothetical protein